jgi:hypothetical protein
VQIGDAGDRSDYPQRAIPFAGVANRIVMRAQHQARQARTLALVTAADIADRIEMGLHTRVAHPVQDQISRRAVFGGQENPREMLRRFGDFSEPVDPLDDLIAEG